MTTGLTLLRVVIGLLICAHGCQKAWGWFGGPGLRATGELFDTWGFRPGVRMAALAATCELLGGTLLSLGAVTPVATALLIGTMIVASAPNARNGLWATHGGVELVALYAVPALAVGFTGPGKLSIDGALGIPHHTWFGWAALIVGVTASAPPLMLRHRVLANGNHGAGLGTHPAGES